MDNKDDLNKKLYNQIKGKIENFEYEPGQKISEVKLANTFNVSRTPVKRVLSLLETEGLILVQPKSGTYIAKINTQKIKEYFTIRQMLETSIISDVCLNLDDKKIEKLKKNIDKQKDLLTSTLPEIEINKRFFKLDNEFHKLIFSFVNKEFVWEFIISQSSQYNRFRLLSATTNNKSLEQKIQQHLDIFNVIINKDIDKVCATYQNHILDNLDDTISKLVLKHESYFE